MTIVEIFYLFLQWCNLTFNDKELRILGTHVKNVLKTRISYLCNLCKCLQIFISVYIGEEHKFTWCKSIMKKIIKQYKFKKWIKLNPPFLGFCLGGSSGTTKGWVYPFVIKLWIVPKWIYCNIVG
jgi:hypothetical protein